jgi:hypothetical protein
MNNRSRQEHLEFTRELQQDGVLEAYTYPEFGLKLAIVIASLKSAITSVVLLGENPIRILGVNPAPILTEYKNLVYYLNIEQSRFDAWVRSTNQQQIPFPLAQQPADKNLFQTTRKFLQEQAKLEKQELKRQKETGKIVSEKNTQPETPKRIPNDELSNDEITERIRQIRLLVLAKEEEKLLQYDSVEISDIEVHDKPSKKKAKKQNITKIFSTKSKKDKNANSNAQTFSECIEFIPQKTNESDQRIFDTEQLTEQPLFVDESQPGPSDYITFKKDAEITPDVTYLNYTQVSQVATQEEANFRRALFEGSFNQSNTQNNYYGNLETFNYPQDPNHY